MTGRYSMNGRRLRSGHSAPLRGGSLAHRAGWPACRLAAVFAILSMMVVTGCAGLTDRETAGRRRAERGKLDSMTAPVRHSWNRVTGTRPVVEIPRWAWSTAMPVDVPRAELLAALISPAAVAHFVPEIHTPQYQLVSTHAAAPAYEIRNIGGHAIRNQADLQRQVASCLENGRAVQIDLAPQGGTESSEFGVRVEPSKLLAVAAASSADQGPARIVADGNPWLMITEGGTTAKVMVRAERSRGLLHVVLSLSSGWGGEQLLPVDVRASADGESLRCLSASEALDRLYAAERNPASAGGAALSGYSFATVSEREDYLVPANCNQLLQKYASREGLSESVSPALVSIPGTAYPGPAVLADARALSGILLQRRVIRAGDRELTGWIIFGGDAAERASFFDVVLDLGAGPRTCRFQVPDR
jgi:hypothetical protein